ncbi:hypothetical protein H0A36_09850 [Endozoicomonas sp. SM1973]|uniref:EscE/YscE/SsaE family type III secretion system needle protein co-chaperone n=1 Tax=Spartinivicinus marinus TaxID=2994442 RepID=A0A853HYP0_9GAMM|nr:EscE/YscE/SsaE family type III secretion system needle protein co-chaperone [Spartinivicinus marinus]MCX4024660.1 hypothetical protein [Spartinivicinus marinus]NYZ66313.1 hypothetical protein [Spartinivicinus marinus]
MQTELLLTDLEVQLTGPHGEDLAHQLLAKLGEEQQQVKAKIAMGLDPQAFHYQQHYLEALQAAEKVIAKVRNASQPDLNEVINGF